MTCSCISVISVDAAGAADHDADVGVRRSSGLLSLTFSTFVVTVLFVFFELAGSVEVDLQRIV